jgi:mannose-1-phosphate guanylyltransferase
VKPEQHVWSIILAAGGGTRVRAMTRGMDGNYVPKQFWALDGRQSLLERTVIRVERVVPQHHKVIVVAEEHSTWWDRQGACIPPENLFVQPLNRGTAAGVFFPLLSILDRDPRATVAVFPSDHVFEREEVVVSALREAIAGIREREADIALLGMETEDVALDCGWILPGSPARPFFRVHSIVEKPQPAVATELHARGAIVNSMILVASAQALVRMMLAALPMLKGAAARFHASLDRAALATLYGALPSFDFTRDVLQPCARSLSALPVRQSGWADLGVPERLQKFLSASVPAPV